MNKTHGSVLKDLVLIGGGHSHVIVLKRFGMDPMPGLRITVIARDIHTPYSGMLPGLIAGHYSFDDIHIDLAPLAQFTGARLYHSEVIGLDLVSRTVLCKNRPPVPYDVLSIDIGVTPVLGVSGSAAHVVPVKPITTLVNRWEQLKARVGQESKSLQVGIVGAGAAGVELTLAVQYALRERLGGDGFSSDEPTFHLFSATPQILPTHNRRVRAKFERVLRERGVCVHTNSRVSAVNSTALEVDSGSTYAMDEVIWATEAGAQKWPATAGLAVDKRGFICVADTLQSTSHADVFAAGDVAAVTNHPREKAGVFAVRQGPPLEANLRRAILGLPLESFSPQKKFLSLISTGNQHAVGSRGSWVVEGRWVWKWKDWIDRRFMAKFSSFPEMPTGDVVGSEQKRLMLADGVSQPSTGSMRCAGCGSKVGATVLERVLSRLSPIHREDVIAGLDVRDDASVERIPAGMVAVRTIDAFPAIVDDPYLFGQITANHCLSDIHAMGADSRTALAIVTLPLSSDDKMEALLEELLSGAVEVLNAADTALVGGHTTEGSELTLGLSLSGVADPARLLRKHGMQSGHQLILTKPIGTGTLFAAHMRLKAKGRWIDKAVKSMLQSNHAASICLQAHGATACTDVTGFGLAGHLFEMARASGVDVTLKLSAVPLLDGARETVTDGILSSLHSHNVRLQHKIVTVESIEKHPLYPVIFDPQTAGGLLASVPVEESELCLRELRALGYQLATVVGKVQPRTAQAERLWVET